MSNYHVVYETIPSDGCIGFIRTTTCYEDESEFISLYNLTNDGKVIAKGLGSYEEAAHLCYMAPTICYYLSAIEESIGDSKLQLDLLDYHLTMAKVGAEHTHKYREVSGLDYNPPEGFEDYLSELCSTTTLKSHLMAAVCEAYMALYDHVSPLSAKVLIAKAAISYTNN